MRQQLTEKENKAKEVKILDNFQGSSIGNYTICNNKIFASFKEEPLVKKDGTTHNYNSHFIFSIKNNSNDLCEIELFIIPN